MSVPHSVRVGPFTPTLLVKKRYIIFYIFLIWISVIPVLYEIWVFWHLFLAWNILYFWVFLPLTCLLMYFTMIFTSLIFAKLLLIIVNAIHKPREGTFLRHPSDKDYRYWSIRATIKRWPVWLSHKFPFPMVDNICFRMFGVKTTLSNSLFEGWVDCEFIDFGKNVVVGQASIIQSAALVGNLLIIRKTIIGDDVRIGAHCVVMPGTHIGNNSILAVNTITTVGQKLEEGWIYNGIPAKKFRKNYFFNEGLEEKLRQQMFD